MSHLEALMRDTFFGQVVYMATGGKVFKHPEDRDDFVVPERYRQGGDRSQTQKGKNEKRSKRNVDANAEKGTRDANGHEAERARDDASRASSEATAVQSRDSGESGEDPNKVDW